MKVYVASSWRNEYQDVVVQALRAMGHDVYDFKHPSPGDNGFSWGDVDARWQKWTTGQYASGLRHPVALAGFEKDFDAMRWAEACVLVLPCGRSAHLEAGWFCGAGKRLVVYVPAPERIEPELMYLLGGPACITDSMHVAVSLLTGPRRVAR